MKSKNKKTIKFVETPQLFNDNQEYTGDTNFEYLRFLTGNAKSKPKIMLKSIEKYSVEEAIVEDAEEEYEYEEVEIL